MGNICTFTASGCCSGTAIDTVYSAANPGICTNYAVTTAVVVNITAGSSSAYSTFSTYATIFSTNSPSSSQTSPPSLPSVIQSSVIQPSVIQSSVIQSSSMQSTATSSSTSTSPTSSNTDPLPIMGPTPLPVFTRSAISSPTAIAGLLCYISNNGSVVASTTAYIGATNCVTYSAYNYITNVWELYYSAVSDSLYSQMLLIPSIFSNVVRCTTDLCNTPGSASVYVPSSTSSAAAAATSSSSSLLCYVMTSNLSSYVQETTPSENTAYCVGYQYKTSYGVAFTNYIIAATNATVTAMALVPTIFKNLFYCNTNYCNNPTTYASMYPITNATVTNSTLRCWVTSDDSVTPFPYNSNVQNFDYCATYVYTSDLDGVNRTYYTGLTTASYNSKLALSSYVFSNACTTDFCNSPLGTSGSQSLQCYSGGIAAYAPVQLAYTFTADYCVKFKDANAQWIYTTVNSATRAIMLADTTNFNSLVSCQTNFCNTP